MTHCKFGFTLVELMVCCLLFTFIVGLTLGGMSFFNQLVVHTHLDTLQAHCKYLQQVAMATNKEQILVCDSKNNSYSFNGSVYKLPTACAFGFLPAVKGPPSAPTTAITNSITFKDAHIVFKPTGIIGSGTLYFIDAQKSCMYALSSGVGHVSFLRKYRYDSKWHEIE